MRLPRLGLANVNTTVGATGLQCRARDFRCLALRRRRNAVRAARAGCLADILLKICCCGRALFLRKRRRCQSQQRRQMLPMVIVRVLVQAMEQGLQLRRIPLQREGLESFPKKKLPLYNVFYEARTLSRGFPGLYAEVPLGPCGKRFRLGICCLTVTSDASRWKSAKTSGLPTDRCDDVAIKGPADCESVGVSVPHRVHATRRGNGRNPRK